MPRLRKGTKTICECGHRRLAHFPSPGGESTQCSACECNTPREAPLEKFEVTCFRCGTEGKRIADGNVEITKKRGRGFCPHYWDGPPNSLSGSLGGHPGS